MPQLSAKNDVIDDPTDLRGTLRPNLLPEPTPGTEFKPLPHPEFDYKIRSGIGAHPPLLGVHPLGARGAPPIRFGLARSSRGFCALTIPN